jgi:hypothetical protein
MIPTFEHLTREFLINAPDWFQDQPVTLKKENYKLFKTVDKINIYKLQHKNKEVNIFILYFYCEQDGDYIYFLSPEAEDEETGKTIYPVYCIGHAKQTLEDAGNITFDFKY